MNSTADLHQIKRETKQNWERYINRKGLYYVLISRNIQKIFLCVRRIIILILMIILKYEIVIYN